MNKTKPDSNFIFRIILFITALALIYIATDLLLTDNAVQASIGYTAALLTLVFVYLAEFKRFKGLGIEAELLDKKISEADEVIKRLRKILISMAELLFAITATAGRLGKGMKDSDRYRLIQAIEEELLANGITVSEIESTKRYWHKRIVIDLSRSLFKDTLSMISDKDRAQNPENLQRSVDELQKIPSDSEFDTYLIRLEDFIKNSLHLNDEDKKNLLSKHSSTIAEIKFYMEHRKLRNLNAWLSDD